MKLTSKPGRFGPAYGNSRRGSEILKDTAVTTEKRQR